MDSFDLKTLLLVTIYASKILMYPMKMRVPPYSALFSEDEKQKSLSAALLSKFEQNSLKNHLDAPGCPHGLSRIMFPLKFHYDDNLLGRGLEDRVNIVDLPAVKQPYQNYKVLVATAPAGLELDDEDSKALTLYVVFDSDNEHNPMNLPAVYFVKKRPGASPRDNIRDPIFVVDSNRTVTNLRSKEIQKFLKFRNKLTNRFSRTSDSEELDSKQDLEIIPEELKEYLRYD
ncbi:uncharacterized protein LOC132903957 [Amyelois transitella]|uniref:uncharacterized protein LOC132903957 n=1 Tax=Amyelois transitella TaxID=680683 RepID=UPI00298FFFA9|nr:uncharacterized protein LOC132903957 [Amyelois transitella]